MSSTYITMETFILNFNQVGVFLSLWLLILTGAFGYFIISWRKMFQGSSGKILKQALEDNLIQTKMVVNKINFLEKEIESLVDQKASYIQKTAFRRFNPFGDTGGDQSFVWACLDEEDNGIILSSLHGRDGTRVYGKKIKNGSVSGHKLSTEEETVLNEAKLFKIRKK